MKNYFLVHSLGRDNTFYWYPWLKKQIENQGCVCYCPNMPPIEKMNYESWEREFDKIAKNLNKDSVVIGHSTGSIFLVHYLMKHKISVAKFIGVVSFNKENKNSAHPDWEKINATFFVDNLSDFKNFAKERICFYSPKDIYDFDTLDSFAKEIGAKKVVIENAGHFVAVTGYGEKFVEILKYL